MNRDAARDETRRILGNVAPLLSPEDIEAALTAAQVTDSDGREPGSDGYVETIDPWLAAAECAELLGIRALSQTGMLKWTSEGTTVERKAADFFGMRDALRAKTNGSGSGVSKISVDEDEDSYLTATGMSGGGYWTWDTDVPQWYPWRT